MTDYNEPREDDSTDSSRVRWVLGGGLFLRHQPARYNETQMREL